MSNGQKIGNWLRWTACFRKIDGKWLIAHMQASAPIDLATGRAVLDLNERVSAIPRADGAGAAGDEAVRDLAKGVDQLVRQMRAEQKVVREWVDEQAAQQSEVATVLKELAASVPRKG